MLFLPYLSLFLCRASFFLFPSVTVHCGPSPHTIFRLCQMCYAALHGMLRNMIKHYQRDSHFVTLSCFCALKMRMEKAGYALYCSCLFAVHGIETDIEGETRNWAFPSEINFQVDVWPYCSVLWYSTSQCGSLSCTEASYMLELIF